MYFSLAIDMLRVLSIHIYIYVIIYALISLFIYLRILMARTLRVACISPTSAAEGDV